MPRPTLLIQTSIRPNFAIASSKKRCTFVPDALALRARQTFEPVSGRLARHAVRLLEGGEVRVERVAEQLGVTARHLRRVFTESIGIGPKDFARSIRLQRAVRRTATSNDSAPSLIARR